DRPRPPRHGMQVAPGHGCSPDSCRRLANHRPPRATTPIIAAPPTKPATWPSDVPLPPSATVTVAGLVAAAATLLPVVSLPVDAAVVVVVAWLDDVSVVAPGVVDVVVPLPAVDDEVAGGCD